MKSYCYPALTLVMGLISASAALTPPPSSADWTFLRGTVSEKLAARAVQSATHATFCEDGTAVVAGEFRPSLQVKGASAQVDSYLELQRVGKIARDPFALLENRRVSGLLCRREGNRDILYVASTSSGGGGLQLERVSRSTLKGALEWSKNPLAAQKGIEVNPRLEVEVVDLEADAQGNLYLLSNLKGEHPTLSSKGDWDVLVQKFSSQGDLLWSQRRGSDASDRARDLALGADGRVWVVGDTKGNLEGQVNSGQSDAFVMALDSKDGALKSARLLGNQANNIATAVGVSPANGNVYVAGYTYAPLGSEQADGDGDAFVALLESGPTLSLKTVQNLGQRGVEDAVRKLVMLPKGQLVAVGDTDGALEGFKSAGAKDLTLTLLDAGLKVLKRQQGGTTGSDGALDVARNSGGELLVVGSSTGGNPELSTAYLTRWSSTLEPRSSILYGHLGPQSPTPAPVQATLPVAFSNLLTHSQTRLELKTSKFTFKLEEAITFEVSVPVDGYLYVLEYNPDQTVTVLYPNKFTPENAVKAGSTVKLPDGKFEFFATEPVGKSQILAFVSSSPLNLYREASAGVDAAGFRTFVNIEACNCLGKVGQKVSAAGLTALETVR